MIVDARAIVRLCDKYKFNRANQSHSILWNEKHLAVFLAGRANFYFMSQRRCQILLHLLPVSGTRRGCQILKFREVQCDQIWRNFTTLAKNKSLAICFRVYLVLG